MAYITVKTQSSTQYDYTNQAWVIDGKYANCAHPAAMKCDCFGRINEGKVAPASNDIY